LSGRLSSRLLAGLREWVRDDGDGGAPTASYRPVRRVVTMTVDRRTDGAPRRDVCELSGASGRRRRRVSIGCTSRETDDTAMRLPATTRRPDVRRRAVVFIRTGAGQQHCSSLVIYHRTTICCRAAPPPAA